MNLRQGTGSNGLVSNHLGTPAILREFLFASWIKTSMLDDDDDCMCMDALPPCVFGIHGGQKRLSYSLRLELQMV